MTKEDKLQIGLALHAIAMSADDYTLERIKPQLEKIEKIVVEQKDTVNVPIMGSVE